MVFSFVLSSEETMRAKQVLATMSHEIRSPLSGVVSMAEILATTKLDREQRQLLDVMLSSGDLVLQLLNDILDLSKVESGTNSLKCFWDCPPVSFLISTIVLSDTGIQVTKCAHHSVSFLFKNKINKTNETIITWCLELIEVTG